MRKSIIQHDSNTKDFSLSLSVGVKQTNRAGRTAPAFYCQPEHIA
jgi:hypothetical protein